MAGKMPAIMIALGKGAPSKKGAPEPGDSSPDMGGEEEEGEVSEEAVSAASELMDAIKSGDAKLVAMAMKNFMKEC